ncbi:MAG: copper amine oxidase N-terminal domain-containing protein [Clostridiales bacterium]|nr:copper amine oxidase N-terminal domain-containing protein [Clostridiales bacterium]
MMTAIDSLRRRLAGGALKPRLPAARMIVAALALTAVLWGSAPLWAGEVLLTRDGLANWLTQKMQPREQKLEMLEGRAVTLERKLKAWEDGHLHRIYLWPDVPRAEYYSPGGAPAGAADMDVPPRIIDGRTMVPLRFVGEALGAEVVWNGETRQVAYILGSRQVLLTVDQSTALVGGRPVEMDTAPRIVGDRTLVPVRFVSQWLGAIVLWDDNLKRVEIRYLRDGLG